ncbi:WD40-repeat-containing domain protein [Zychaea mexicana]|uniref:WD40-repeat-containing domain protein n=1 Tax=Zychaea mexicana TaxID=64656 RepID=UPI0022FEA347|nr:WD40-repeat-containing domain protein [Zychaea mexicana]KAI9491452.1 WD40-repeat-containing domain protein [Zychaea mexicana]
MIYLPQICPQPDWHGIIPEISDHSTADTSFWISCYRKGYTSIHSNINVERVHGAQKLKIRGENEVDVEYINSRTLKASCPKIGVKDAIIHAPRREWKSPRSKPILAIDATSDGQLYAYSSEQHIVVAALGDNETRQMIMQGHLADVTAVRFFPSNQVLLSGASDFRAKIWSIQDGSNPVTLTGHTAGITDLAIVSRGKNVLTSSRDGTIRLWHCGTGSTISVLGNYNVPVTTMTLESLPSNYKPADQAQLDEREFETADKMILVGLNDGSVRGIHLGTKQEFFSIQSGYDKVSALKYDTKSSILLVATMNGLVQAYELVDPSKPRLQWQRSDHAVTALVIHRTADDALLAYVSNADGSIYCTNDLISVMKDDGDLALSTEYSGNELEPINSIVLAATESDDKTQILCCNREGYIKVY